MSRADDCIKRILKHEGGFVNHPRDPGGATNKGITLATFRRYIDPRGTVEDLKRLSTAQAIIVYKRQYWDAVKADQLPIGVDYAVADFAVNSGPSRAARYLQGVVNVAQDGVIGPKTLAAVEDMDPRVIVEVLCARRLAFLKRLSTWGDFGRGWSRRVQEVERDALADIGDPARPDVEPITHPDPQEQGGLWARILAALFGLFGK